MTTHHLMRSAAPLSNILAFVRPERCVDASYDRALARRETELSDALAKVQVLRRQCGEMSQLAEEAVFAARETAAVCVASLTARQREVMEMVLAGRASKLIAWELGISRRTVENHRATIMKKTGSKSIPALARFAIAAAWNGTGQPVDAHKFAVTVLRPACGS